jgi:glycosyltransferase involved in cell wall biosynthesis
MKISIITATYNSASTLRDTLSSIQGQDHDDVEHIIVDGLSTDNTLDIVREYPHISCLVSEKDEGIYDAMNKGIRLANGDVIGILNSDDIYTSQVILSRIASIFEAGAVDVCYADLQYVQRENTDRVLRTWKAGQFRPGSFHRGWMPPHPTVFVRREVYSPCGLFNTSLRSAADYELLLRIFVKHRFRIHYMPECIVRMRIGGLSNATFRQRLRANREDRKAWKINDLRPGFFTLYLKPIRKISQFINR